MLDDVLGTWIAPSVAIVVGGLVTIVVSALLARAKEKRTAEQLAIDTANRQKQDAEASRERLLKTFENQLSEVHTALLGEKASAFNPEPPPGIVGQLREVQTGVTTIHDALYNPENGILVRLGRVEENGGQHG